jgi:hypothetical protein
MTIDKMDFFFKKNRRHNRPDELFQRFIFHLKSTNSKSVFINKVIRLLQSKIRKLKTLLSQLFLSQMNAPKVHFECIVERRRNSFYLRHREFARTREKKIYFRKKKNWPQILTTHSMMITATEKCLSARE